MKASNLSMKGIGLSAGVAGLALGGLFFVVGELAARQQRARELAQEYADIISEGADKIGESARKLAIEQLKKGGDALSFNWQSAYDASEKLGVSLDTVTSAALGNKSAMADLGRYYKAFNGDQGELNKIMSETGMNAFEVRFALEAMVGGINNQNDASQRGTELKKQETEATEGSVDASKTAAESCLDESKKVDELNSQLSELINKINETNGTNQDAVSSNARYQEALAGISDAVQKQRDEFEKAHDTLDGFALSLDESTVSGSANAAMLSDVAGAAQTAAEKQYEVDRATMSGKDAADKYAATLADQKQKFIDSAVAAGFSPRRGPKARRQSLRTSRSEEHGRPRHHWPRDRHDRQLHRPLRHFERHHRVPGCAAGSERSRLGQRPHGHLRERWARPRPRLRNVGQRARLAVQRRTRPHCCRGSGSGRAQCHRTMASRARTKTA